MPRSAEAKERVDKEAIFQQVADHLKAKGHKNIGITGGREVCLVVWEAMFKTVVEQGFFRFPEGMGSLKLKDCKAGTKTLPGGAKVAFSERKKVSYEQGKLVRDLLTAKGYGHTSSVEGSDAPAETEACPA